MNARLGSLVLAGAVTFAAAGAVFGYVWTAFEFPFVMGLQWVLGAGVLGWLAGGKRLAWREAVAGGLAFILAFTLFLFIALAVLEIPVPLALSAGVAGSVMGAVAAGGRGAWRLGLAAFLGFAVAEVGSIAIIALTPESANTPGVAQYTWFAAGQAFQGLIGGAALGAGLWWAIRGRESAQEG